MPPSRKGFLSDLPVMDAKGAGRWKRPPAGLRPGPEVPMSDDLIRQDAVTLVGRLKIAAYAPYLTLGRS
jgi:hypothetical protein